MDISNASMSVDRLNSLLILSVSENVLQFFLSIHSAVICTMCVKNRQGSPKAMHSYCIVFVFGLTQKMNIIN